VPRVPDQDDAYIDADQADAHAALEESAQIIASGQAAAHEWTELSARAYRWLRNRDSLRVVRIELKPGKPGKEGKVMTTTYNLEDDDEVQFSLTGFDAKDAPVAAPSDTWTWTLADPDSSGATLTVSEDTTTATVAGGVPDTNLLLSVTGADSGLSGAEAIIVVAGAVATIGLVPGTPTPETPAG
jgi:hypothetical protein